MLDKKRLHKRILFIGVPIVLFALSIFSGFASDVGTAITARVLPAGQVYSLYDGLISLEETILMSDVIAVVDLDRVDRGVGVWKFDTEVGYSKTLEFTFQVKEYLKGSGGDRIVGVVFDWSQVFNTAAGANLGIEPDPDRKGHWDNRTAVVFLRDDGKDPDVNWDADRYYLGISDDWEGESYSVANRYYRAWLPAASDSDDEQRFLLEPDLGNSSPQTITLDDLRLMVSAFDSVLAGQTDAYKDCVLFNYRWQREVRYFKESLGGTYYYARDDTYVDSGMPKGAKVFTDQAAFFVEEQMRTAPPDKLGQYVLAGRDEQYFRGALPGEIFTDRPLPAGTYRVNYSYLPYPAPICGATVPEDEMGRLELFVNVTAPEGTLHEAFFDPVEDGKAVLAGGANGVLEPAAFTNANGASATLQRIAWEDNAVKLTLSPHNGIAGHTVYFIALDGSVALSLKVAEAEVDETAGTLTWKVESQPWQAGDKLMLRISASTK